MPTLQCVRVDKSPLTFMRAVTFSSWATVMGSLHEKELWKWKFHAYILCPLMHSGQSPVSGYPDSVQLEKSMHIECVGSHDHHSQSSFFPQVLWQVSGSRAFPRKLTEYSWIKKKTFNTAISTNKLETNLALSIHIALIFVRYPHDSSLPLLWRYVKR